MEKYKKEIKIAKIAIAVVIIVLSIIASYKNFQEIMTSFHEQSPTNYIWVYPIAFVESIIAGLVENIYLVGAYVAFLLATRSANRTRLDETDFEKNKKFYRDTVNNYSVSVLNYIDNFKLDYKQSYTAKLLELQKNKCITIKDDKIKVIKEPENELDKEFVKSIKDNKVTMSLYDYKKLVEEEALEKGLITPASLFGGLKDKKMRLIIAIVIIVMFALVFLVSFLQNTDLMNMLFLAGVLSLLLIGFIFFFFMVYLFIYIGKILLERRYQRTEKGKEINLQLDGLKMFMEEFSNIKSKESKHLVLWDDYLIYSVMFNINEKIQNEYSKFFNSNNI